MHTSRIDLLQQQIARDSGDIRARLLLGCALMKSGRNMDAATLFRRVTELEPDCIEAWRWLGAAYGQTRLFKEAGAAYRAALYLAEKCGAADTVVELRSALNLLPDAHS
ncbi:MAG: tetratricopeptide repeat protein [bacterium]|nr:tetratricopeptide repeat protein [Candidatus Sumerlaeota bacterium]